jgi:sugar transferase (PEP-CTERM/EpsH1 system associated)
VNIVFISHRVPFPPDKGEKIRAFYELTHLAKSHDVHLACLARNRDEVSAAHHLLDRCKSVDVELRRPAWALAGAGMRFAAGDCLTTSFYHSRELSRRIARRVKATPMDAAVVYTAAMAPYVPAGLPMVLDLVDVDSEKWMNYASFRRPGAVYGLEGRRLRGLESRFAANAACSFLTTQREVRLFKEFSPDTRVKCVENGVDFDFFDPARTPRFSEHEGRRFLVFVGAMDYYPNIDAVKWFARHIFPALRRRMPGLEFFIVGRDPASEVRALGAEPGIHVTGTVGDVRPYVKASLAVVAPLRIARGVQNKVLEALAMGKRVLASPEVCETLAPIPAGIRSCATAEDYIHETASATDCGSQESSWIRTAAERRFQWEHNMQALSEELCALNPQISTTLG